MGKLLCHMWLPRLLCFPGGMSDCETKHFIYLYHSFLMNKNRKYGKDHNNMPFVQRKKTAGCAPIMKKFLLLSVPEQRSKMFFPPLSFIYDWVKLSWHICATCVPFFPHLLKTLPLRPCFYSSCASQHGSTHICSGESGPSYPPKWDPFWCDIWENYQCMGEQRKRLDHSFAIG